MINHIILALALFQQPADTVAITVTRDGPVEILSRVEAEAQFAKLCEDSDVSLVFDNGRTVITVKRSEAERIARRPEAVIAAFTGIGKMPMRTLSRKDVQDAALAALQPDEQRLRALAVALNPMPNWPQFVMNGDASVCNRAPKPIIPIPIEKQSGSAFTQRSQN